MVEIVYNPNLTVTSEAMELYNETQWYRTHVLEKLNTVVKVLIKDLEALHHSCCVKSVVFDDEKICFSLMMGDNPLTSNEIVFTFRNADMLEWLFNRKSSDSYMNSNWENIHEMKRLTDYIATRTD